MTDTTTAKLITQLRTLQALTNTEAQIAQTRQVQARDQAVRDELATNAANAHDRAQLIAAALRDLGGVPDVVTPALGRASALAKTVVEQGQPIAAALFGDLALEHQLLDRAGYLEALADTADHARYPKPGAAPAGCTSTNHRVDHLGARRRSVGKAH